MVQIDAYLRADFTGRTSRITPYRMGAHSHFGISITRGSERNCARYRRTAEGVAGLASVANALAADGVAVEDLSLRQPTLDEVFLTLTGAPADDVQPSNETEEARP